MMKRLQRFGLGLASCVFLAAPVRAETAEEIIGVTQTYFAALQRGEYQKLARLSSPALRKRAGGEAQVAELYRQFYDDDARRLLLGESVQRVSWFAEGSAKVYLVEATREIDSFPSSQWQSHLYAVSASGDDGLKVLDLGCISVDWVDELAPGFRNSELAKDLLARGLIQTGR